MVTPWYIAVETFDPSWGETWENYMEGAGLPQLREVVSLDSSLCPSVIRKLEEKDWKHNVHEDGLTDFFYDLDYLLSRVAGMPHVNLLAADRNPAEECRDALRDQRFEFKGYDLKGFGMSALVNCGGFPLAFRNEELSDCGLIPTLARAWEVQAALLENYPEHGHADCSIWALWKMRGMSRAG